MNRYMPQATLDRLTGPKCEGSRHADILAISLSLVGEEWPEGEIFQVIRENFPEDKTDKEIWDAIKGARNRAPAPSAPRNPKPLVMLRSEQPVAITAEQARHNAERFLAGFSVDEPAVTALSPVPIDSWQSGASQLFSTLYDGDDHLNIITLFTQPDGKPNKANPQGSGKTMIRGEWLSWFADRGVPASEAGAWVRPNPVKPTGSGAGGAIMDTDVTKHDFLLVESDCLPLSTQLGILARLRLPIAAIIYSGGSSYHAWVKLHAYDRSLFGSMADRILKALAKFGIDKANKNPSRLARLPGAPRIIGASNGGLQKLIYLNPEPSSTPICDG